MNTAFKDKVVIVTGSGRGIGRKISLAYSQHMAKVVVAEINEELGMETVSLIKVNGGNAEFLLTDVSKPEDIFNLMAQTENIYGKLDILINNAGIATWKSPFELEVEEWDKIINTNLRGMFLCAREGAKIMKKHGGGAIINIASTRALMSEPHSEAYAASKGGILALTHALAASFAPDNIQVNAISPGWIETVDYSGLKQEDHLQHFSNRVGKPEDIASACLYLSNPQNNFINGTNLVIDGGMTKKMIYVE